MSSKPPPQTNDVLGLDEDEPNELDDWNSVPRNARLFVYASLEKQIAEMDQALMLNQLMWDPTQELPEDAPPDLTARRHAIAALLFAKELLRAADEELCQDCGNYHDNKATHPKSSKDVS